MAALKNGKHEKFAQGLANGLTADQAYESAGYKPNRGNATRLKANESVMKRVAELQAGAAEKAEWSAADRLKTLSEIVDNTAKSDPRVAVSAIAEANKMQGSHAPSKNEHSDPGGWEQTEDRTWRQVLRGEKS
jgi:phage terminase small subunit